ncbi:MAG: putative transporter [Verrucomicrobiaceae bacterium]|nr:putative transporter [Verrucomicrobiaceae bacterium]
MTSLLPLASAASSETATALVLLAAVSAGGLALGSVKIRGIGLGSAGVMFVGLIVGSFGFHLEPSVLEFLREFGLMLFVFTMGLQLGPGFFASLRHGGIKLNLCALGIVLVGAAVNWLFGVLFQVQAGARLGILSGATTNTPSLGAAQQALVAVGAPPEQLALPTLAYSASYPIGIIGIIATLLILRKIFSIDVAAELKEFESSQTHGVEPLVRLNVVVDNAHLDGLALRNLPGRRETGVMISRIQCANSEEVTTATEDTILHTGDCLLLVGTAEHVANFQKIIGSPTDIDLMRAQGSIQFRRVVVTNRKMLGKTIAELGLDSLYGVSLTRIVRAGVEMTAVPNIRLQFGDFLHVVGESSHIDRAAEALGNSLLALNQTQFIPVFIGLALGVLAGLIPVFIPGLSSPLRLGLAGGPLIVAILLSRVGKIGPLVWHMPANTNIAFRELGISLFLACVGLTAGPKFFATVMSRDGLLWAGVAVLVVMVPLLLVGLFARRALKLNFIAICGLLTGSMTDPPALAFSNGMVGSDAPSVAYATVYPLTMLCRILVAQVMVLLFFS